MAYLKLAKMTSNIFNIINLTFTRRQTFADYLVLLTTIKEDFQYSLEVWEEFEETSINNK